MEHYGETEGDNHANHAAHLVGRKPVGHCSGSSSLPTSRQFPPLVLTQVALMVNLLGTAMKLTGLKPVDFVPQEADLQFQLIREDPILMACPTFLLFRCRQTIKYEPKQTIKSDRREREGDKNIKLGQKHFLSLF